MPTSSMYCDAAMSLSASREAAIMASSQWFSDASPNNQKQRQRLEGWARWQEAGSCGLLVSLEEHNFLAAHKCPFDEPQVMALFLRKFELGCASYICRSTASCSETSTLNIGTNYQLRSPGLSQVCVPQVSLPDQRACRWRLWRENLNTALTFDLLRLEQAWPLLPDRHY